ncbi:hypothetical protein COLO4_16228 [Corchorus olitorius]|uniref:Uncharacterized protein n=1 Tax=Corchorus olitorius TaxID=93759 RepID=A0A1R3JIM4_9ROSI|nr:hypothetical protein COLO4_16228 [Corchorus olitorius]
MGEGKGSTLVHLLVVVLSLVAFGFAIAAERRRSVGTVVKDEISNATYCVYNSDVATGYGVGAFLFLLSEACLIAGATRNAYHTKYRGMIYAQNFSCETLRKGVFIAGAVFVVATMVLNVYYYIYFTKATTKTPAHKANRPSSNVGMTGYA